MIDWREFFFIFIFSFPFLCLFVSAVHSTHVHTQTHTCKLSIWRNAYSLVIFSSITNDHEPSKKVVLPLLVMCVFICHMSCLSMFNFFISFVTEFNAYRRKAIVWMRRSDILRSDSIDVKKSSKYVAPRHNQINDIAVNASNNNAMPTNGRWQMESHNIFMTIENMKKLCDPLHVASFHFAARIDNDTSENGMEKIDCKLYDFDRTNHVSWGQYNQ